MILIKSFIIFSQYSFSFQSSSPWWATSPFSSQPLLPALQLWLSWHRSSALLLSQLLEHWPTPSLLMPRLSSKLSWRPASLVKERLTATTLMLTTTARFSTSACQLKMTLGQLLRLLTGASSAATRPSLTRLPWPATTRQMLCPVLRLPLYMVLLSLERLMLKFSKPETVSSLSEYGDGNQNLWRLDFLCCNLFLNTLFVYLCVHTNSSFFLSYFFCLISLEELPFLLFCFIYFIMLKWWLIGTGSVK